MSAQIGEFALQYYVIGVLRHAVVRDDVHRQMTMAEEMISATAGGSICALYTSPMELLMVQQQNFGGTLPATAQRVWNDRGLTHGVFRGIFAGALRDGAYTLGLLGITPMMQSALQKRFQMNESAAGLISSIFSGVLCGALSCPFDVIKTSMQGDLMGHTYPTFTKTLIVQRKRLFSGLLFRCMNVVGTIAIANEMRVRAAPLMFPREYEQ